MAGVDGTSIDRAIIQLGRASSGQTKPAENTRGSELNNIAGVASVK